MTVPAGDAFEAGLRIAAALDAVGVPYALGGALAYGQYGIPRATDDVGVNVFVTPGELGPAVAALGSLGIEVDLAATQRDSEREGMFVARYGDFRIDVFVPNIDFSWEAQRTSVRHHIEGRDVWFLSAEAIAGFKLLFGNPRSRVGLVQRVF